MEANDSDWIIPNLQFATVVSARDMFHGFNVFPQLVVWDLLPRQVSTMFAILDLHARISRSDTSSRSDTRRKYDRSSLTWLHIAFALVASACSAPTAPDGIRKPSPDSTYATFNSQFGDPVGGGYTYWYTEHDAVIRATTVDARSTVGGSANWGVQIRIEGKNPLDFWFIRVNAPWGQQLGPGVYEAVGPAGVSGDPRPGLSAMYSRGSYCDSPTMRFVIREISYAPFGAVERLHLTFDVQCSAAAGHLTGDIKILA